MARRQDTTEVRELAAAHRGDPGAWRMTAAALAKAERAGDMRHTALLAAALMIEGQLRGNYRGFADGIARLAPARDPAFRWDTPDDELLALTGLLTGLLYFGNDDPVLPACVDRMLGLLEQDVNVNLRFAAARLLLFYCEPRELRVLSQRIFSLAAPLREDPVLTPHRLAHFLAYWARVSRYAGESRQAQAADDEVRALATRHALMDIQRSSAYIDLERCLPSRDLARAQQALAHLERLTEPSNLPDMQRLEFARTKLAALEGQHDRALFHAIRASQYAAELAFPPVMRAVYIVSEAQARLALDEFSEARRLLADAATLVPGTYVREIEDMAEFVRAYELLRGGQHEAGVARLAAAWRGVRERQFYDTFDGFPAFAARLCAIALEHGIEPEFVCNLIAMRNVLPPPEATAEWPWPVRIRALGPFVVECHGKALTFEGKAQKKPIQLLKVLTAFGGRAVPKERLQEALWPDDDASTSSNALNVLIMRTRKLLGDASAVRVDEGKAGFDPARVWLDVWAFDADVEALQSALRDPARATEVSDIAARLVACYRGPFLGDEDPQRWSLSARDRWQGRLRRSLADAGRRREECGDPHGAIALYSRALEVDSLAEDVYRRLMRALLIAGEPAEALRVYRRCRDVLAMELGVPPSGETQALARSIHA
ncbi:MAG: winged helix-turn-helix domain-containing protein [Proteobacteria bacterium]|nr:winged helix-turn-helix domain-containing protein [Pseudomonadota bacterium]